MSGEPLDIPRQTAPPFRCKVHHQFRGKVHQSGREIKGVVNVQRWAGENGVNLFKD